MKKLLLFLVVLLAVGAGAYWYRVRTATVEPAAQTMPLSRGDVVETVGATGTLEAVETVDVGTQVSGVIQALYADFNSIVRKGQVIAKLDPQLIETQIEQQKANVVRAEAEVDRLRVSLADARQKLERAKELSARNLIPRTELETAEVNVKSIDAQIRSSEAALTQARAQLNNQQVNLAYTTITAPIDGIVISRNVDQGQTVAASMNAPTLYVIAADLTKMQVIANIDEADVGRMRPGQPVTFRVDSYPTETFRGTVSQVRLQPAVVQNVVTYSTVIQVPNPELKLKPGMTANVTIEIARRDNVLRIPNRALAFRPTAEIFAALDQEVPPELERGRGGLAGRGGRGVEGARAGGAQAGTPPAAADGPSAGMATAAQAPPASTAAGGRAAAPSGQATARPPAAGGAAGTQATAPAGAQAGEAGPGRGFGGRGGFDPNMSPEERQRRMQERLAQMSPEERQRFEERMRQGGGRGGFGGREGAPAAGPGGSNGGRQAASDRAAGAQTGPGSRGNAPAPRSAGMASGATTIDSLFAPIQVSERPGMAWLFSGRQLKPLRLRLGLADANFTEIVNESEIPENTEVVVTLTTGLEQRATSPTNPQGNPLMGPQRGGPGGRGGAGGGGGRGRG